MVLSFVGASRTNFHPEHGFPFRGIKTNGRRNRLSFAENSKGLPKLLYPSVLFDVSVAIRMRPLEDSRRDRRTFREK